MILQALKEYYDRKAADPDSEIAPIGFEWKEIPYIVVIDSTGKSVSLACTYEGTGKQRRAKRFLVAQTVKRTAGVAGNFLWDNPEYALGIDLKGKPDRVVLRHKAFVDRIKEMETIGDDGVTALLTFLDQPDKKVVIERFDEVAKQLIEEGSNVSFRLAGEMGLISDSPKVRAFIQKSASVSGTSKVCCMVTGDVDDFQETHPAIKGVWGAQTSGANIVSFNQSAFRSFGKEQAGNSPVGKQAVFAYTTALNGLLHEDSKQRMQVGDASTVFWAEKETDLESHFVDIFGEAAKDNPDAGVKAVEGLFKAINNGAYAASESQTRFYVLGLAPNAARISVRFWIVGTAGEMAGKIASHFKDLEIDHGPKDRPYFSLFRLLVSTASSGKSENISPNLSGDVMRAILQGLPYPETLLHGVTRRIRAEREVTHIRAAIIKACINRKTRFNNPHEPEEIKVSLDIKNTNIGYRLGRLFATLEKIQQEASPGINATIRDKFYGAASGSPVTVFGNLMRLKNHHLAKLENQGRRVNLERLLGEIMDEIGDFPAHLPIGDQGRFSIGYYHQMQSFYTKKTEEQKKLNINERIHDESD